MPQLVRQRHHVAGASVIVQQQIRMRRRHGRMRERPARLAGLQRRIDPRPVEEAPADRGQIGTERAVRRQHPLARIVPRDRAVVIVGQRRIAVPVHQLRQAEPLRLHQVVAMRQPREVRAHRRDQCVDNLILHHVGAVAVAAGARVVPPRIDDLLVLRQRVGDQREQPDIPAERLADRTRRGLAHRTVAIREIVQRRADREVLAADRHPHARDRLIEQPAPRAAPGHLLLVQQLLQVVGKLVRPEDAQIAQPGFPPGQRRFRELLIQQRIVQPVQLEREEQQVAADRGHPLAHGLVEAADLRRWWNRPRTATGHRTPAGPAPPRSARTRRSPRRARRPASRRACPGAPPQTRAPPVRPWRSRPGRPGCPVTGRDRPGPRSAGSRRSIGWRRHRLGRYGASLRPREAAVVIHVR